MRVTKSILLVAVLVAVSGRAEAGIVSMDEFAGSIQETWESFPNYGTPAPVTFLSDPSSIFGGAATISHPLMAVYEPSAGWSFGLGTSGPAQVADGTKAMGINQRSTTTLIRFLAPVTMFGGYWGTATGGAFAAPNSVEVRFFDVLGAPIGSETFRYLRSGRDGVLEWHGWASTIPIGALEYTGDYVVNDSLRTEPIPEPATSVLLGFGLGVLALRVRARPR